MKKISRANFTILAYITPILSDVFQDIPTIFGFLSYYLIFQENTMWINNHLFYEKTLKKYPPQILR